MKKIQENMQNMHKGINNTSYIYIYIYIYTHTHIYIYVV